MLRGHHRIRIGRHLRILLPVTLGLSGLIWFYAGTKTPQEGSEARVGREVSAERRRDNQSRLQELRRIASPPDGCDEARPVEDLLVSGEVTLPQVLAAALEDAGPLGEECRLLLCSAPEESPEALRWWFAQGRIILESVVGDREAAVRLLGDEDVPDDWLILAVSGGLEDHGATPEQAGEWRRVCRWLGMNLTRIDYLSEVVRCMVDLGCSGTDLSLVLNRSAGRFSADGPKVFSVMSDALVVSSDPPPWVVLESLGQLWNEWISSADRRLQAGAVFTWVSRFSLGESHWEALHRLAEANGTEWQELRTVVERVGLGDFSESASELYDAFSGLLLRENEKKPVLDALSLAEGVCAVLLAKWREATPPPCPDWPTSGDWVAGIRAMGRMVAHQDAAFLDEDAAATYWSIPAEHRAEFEARNGNFASGGEAVAPRYQPSRIDQLSFAGIGRKVCAAAWLRRESARTRALHALLTAIACKAESPCSIRADDLLREAAGDTEMEVLDGWASLQWRSSPLARNVYLKRALDAPIGWGLQYARIPAGTKWDDIPWFRDVMRARFSRLRGRAAEPDLVDGVERVVLLSSAAYLHTMKSPEALEELSLLYKELLGLGVGAGTDETGYTSMLASWLADLFSQADSVESGARSRILSRMTGIHRSGDRFARSVVSEGVRRSWPDLWESRPELRPLLR